MKHYFYLNAFYKYPGYVDIEREEKIEKLAKKFNGKDSGAGTDWKLRDINFTFKTFSETRKFYREAKKRRWIMGANISIMDQDYDGTYADMKELLV